MAPRDPIKTARNKIADEMTVSLRKILPKVLEETGIETESSLNAIIGGKSAHYIDLHHEVILSPDAYATLYMKGFKTSISPPGAKYRIRTAVIMRRSVRQKQRKNTLCYFLNDHTYAISMSFPGCDRI
jgi:hypothetical protein